MLARCRRVEDGCIDIANDPILKINSNHNFWTYKEVYATNKESVVKFVITGSSLRIGSDIDTKRKNISIFNEVERLNKHSSIFINYLKQLAKVKGYGFNIEEMESSETVSKLTSGNYRLDGIKAAEKLTHEQYEELSKKKKQGKTTTEENFMCERFFWEKYLLQKELDEELLKNFMYGENPLENFVALIDARNHRKEDNLRSAKFMEKVKIVKKLLEGLGFDSAMGRKKVSRDTIIENWKANIVNNEAFNMKRINEVFNLAKKRFINEDMNTRQILPWVNMLIGQFGINIKLASTAKYKIVESFDIMGLIKRKNKNGRFYMDADNLLKQAIPSDDLFIDDDGFVSRKKEKKDFSLLDRGVNQDF